MQKRYIPFAVFFVILLVLLASFGSRTVRSEATFAFAESEKQMYLTFDDGPSTVVTEKILDVLKEEDVKATFFVVSDRAKTRRSTLKRIADEGHTVGVHSATHDYSKIYASDDALLRDVSTCANFIYEVTGKKPTCYRFPGGGIKNIKHKTALLENAGYTVVSWNAVCGDEEIPHADADTLYNRAVQTAAGKNKVVLLCHDSASHKATAEALKDMIRYFRKEGYVFRAF